MSPSGGSIPAPHRVPVPPFPAYRRLRRSLATLTLRPHLSGRPPFCCRTSAATRTRRRRSTAGSTGGQPCHCFLLALLWGTGAAGSRAPPWLGRLFQICAPRVPSAQSWHQAVGYASCLCLRFHTHGHAHLLNPMRPCSCAHAHALMPVLVMCKFVPKHMRSCSYSCSCPCSCPRSCPYSYSMHCSYPGLMLPVLVRTYSSWTLRLHSVLCPKSCPWHYRHLYRQTVQYHSWVGRHCCSLVQQQKE